jgi:transcription antitermination factor NusG
MKMMRLAFLAATAGVAAGVSAVADPEKGSKSAAVEKVIKLLEDLQTTVLEEGEKEAATYNKFACFCKDTTKDKSSAITAGEDSKDELTAEIGSLSDKRADLDDDIKALEEDIEEAEKEMKEAEEARAKELKKYTADEADLSGALDALEGAIQAMKASKPSLMQMTKMSRTLEMAAGMADALGLETEKAKKALAFLQQTDVPSEDYKFHSGDIISTLEDLLKDFKATKADVDKAEVEAVQEHNMFMQEKENLVKTKEGELNTAKKEKDKTVADIATASQDLSTTAANLLADKEYLMKLSDMCGDKAKTWDARSKVRQDELSAITQAIAIVSGAVKEKTSAATIRFAQAGMSVKLAEAIVRDPDAMEAVEADAEAEDAAPSFVQKAFLRRRAPKGDGTQAVMEMLLSNSKKLHSAMLSSLASQIGSQGGADKFAKIKTLISQLIERLLKESAAEANQKGWCDKALSDASQKRDYAAEEVMTLNANLAKLEATRDKLTQELKVLEEEIKELKSKRKDASDERDEEKTENEATVKEAGEGLDAVQEAITVLEQFYGTAKNAKVDLELVQKQPEIDAPDAGFDNGEAYKGAGGKAGGVIGMLEVIEGDFQRTISETEAAEKQAAQDHLAFMTETGKSLAEKEQAEKEKDEQKDAAESSIIDDGETMTAQNKILKGAVKELIELQATCIDTGMSYEERVARREEEMAALKKALCIFENFEAYGPDAAGAGVCE